MTSTVKNFVRECDICQRCKANTTVPGGLLQPLSIPNAIWEDISMDFISGLPASRGYNVIMVVVDRLSKYAHFVLLKHPYTARSVADEFIKEIVRLHGIPSTIVSDRDPLFISKFWQEIFRAQGTKLHMSSAYHPESDGQTEVINRCLEAYLRCFAVDQPKSWALWLPWAEFWYNSTFHISTGVTPFESVYGRPPPSVFSYAMGEIRVEAVARELQDRDEALRQLKAHLANAQNSMKAQANKKRREISFSVGEWVYVKLKPYRQTSVHPVFHVSLLKRAVSEPTETVLPPDLSADAGEVMIHQEVLAARTVQLGEETTEQWLIHWQGQLVEDATWEDKDWVTGQFPNIRLGDKTRFEGESSNTHVKHGGRKEKPPILFVYSRRGQSGNTTSG
ncbi:putative nucleotidyltransferase, Ribonuclease H [Helianthus debilis subsp. tardiflorus]